MKSFFLVCIIVSSLAVAQAQTFASLSGVVADPSGAFIPRAEITLTNSETNAQRVEQSDAQGRYSFAQVQPGTYDLAARAPGTVRTT